MPERKNIEHYTKELKSSGQLLLANWKGNKAPNIQDRSNEIYNYWLQRMQKGRGTKYSLNRKKKVLARLKDGYSFEFILKAIDGCASSAFHMGDNEHGTIYDDLELICRSGEKLEQFAANLNSRRGLFENVGQTKTQRIQQQNRQHLENIEREV